MSAKFSPLSFVLSNGVMFSIPPEEYMLDGAELGNPGFCIFGVQGGLDASMNMYILGDVFLKSFYSVYDFENRQVGLALHIYSVGTVG